MPLFSNETATALFSADLCSRAATITISFTKIQSHRQTLVANLSVSLAGLQQMHIFKNKSIMWQTSGCYLAKQLPPTLMNLAVHIWITSGFWFLCFLRNGSVHDRPLYLFPTFPVPTFTDCLIQENLPEKKRNL